MRGIQVFLTDAVNTYVRTNRRKRGSLTDGTKSFERVHKIGQGVELHIQRAAAQIVPNQGVGTPKVVVHAMVMINEISPVGITLFSQKSFGNGQPVTLNIPDLQNFFVKGKISACQEVPMSPGILRNEPFKFRVQIRFDFGDEAERQAVKEYCLALQQQYLHRPCA
jgi:hypothetical protein